MIPGLILVVDDEPRQRETLAQALGQWGHTVLQAADGEQALGLLTGEPVDLVMTDLRMPGMSGLDLLARCQENRPDVAIIVMTAFGTIEGAVEAMRQGASDFLTKPLDLDQLEIVVRRTMDLRNLVRENRRLRRRLAETSQGFRMIGESPALQAVMDRAGRAAETDATVLILGESGTGKELLARSIHDLGARCDGPFVAVNCAALPETLLESELFGHVKGAFTGADRDRRGRVQQAEGGTLFLDEIGEVPPPVQVKLLRFLQDQSYTPLGGERPQQADVRLLAATHRDLVAAAKVGEFREDLYFRLNVVNLVLPPLRRRRQDIPALVEHFLGRYAHRYGRPARTVSAEAMARIMSYPFPGNVRELENVIEQSVVMARGEVIHAADLPAALAATETADADGLPVSAAVNGDLPRLLETLEKKIVLETLATFDGNQSSTARHLGLSESGLRYKLSKWKEDDSAAD